MNEGLKELSQIPIKLGPLVGVALLIASSSLLLLLGAESIGLVTLLAKLGFGFMIIGVVANALQWLFTKSKLKQNK